MSIRFWTYHKDSYVRLTIKPGQVLRHHDGGPDDEGWWSESTRWYLDDDECLHRETINDGRDCDGRLTRFHHAKVPLNELSATLPPTGDKWFHVLRGQRDFLVLRLPAWQRVSESQRDEYAEAMGY